MEYVEKLFNSASFKQIQKMTRIMSNVTESFIKKLNSIEIAVMTSESNFILQQTGKAMTISRGSGHFIRC